MMRFQMNRLWHRNRLLLVAGVWLLAAGTGFVKLQKYAGTPGLAGEPAVSWPAQQAQLDPSRATLVMLAHPHCACTRSSIESLARIMASCQGLVTARVLFYKPAGFPADWERTDLWHSAAAIPGVEVLCDEEGLEAQRFGATTSGQVFLYSPHGKLLFSGGITISRGHEGDNAGLDAVIAFLTQGQADRSEFFVFGCPLQASIESTIEGNAP